MIINDIGQIISIKVTKITVDDRNAAIELNKKCKDSIYINR